MDKIKILLADDHQLILNGISQIIAKTENFDLCATASNGKIAEALIEEHQPDVIVLDIEMPELSGLEVLENLSGNKNIKIIILSVYEESSMINKCIELGAKGYLLKRTDPEELVNAINRVHKGGIYIAQEVAEIIISKTNTINSTDYGRKNLNLLSKRELEILGLIVDGYSNSEIAEMLFISKRTVDTHRVNLMQKLEIHNIVELVKFALSNNI